MPAGIALRTHRRPFGPGIESVIPLPPRRLIADKRQSLGLRSPRDIRVTLRLTVMATPGAHG
jgi:hypothetical protein